MGVLYRKCISMFVIALLQLTTNISIKLCTGGTEYGWLSGFGTRNWIRLAEWVWYEELNTAGWVGLVRGTEYGWLSGFDTRNWIRLAEWVWYVVQTVSSIQGVPLNDCVVRSWPAPQCSVQSLSNIVLMHFRTNDCSVFQVSVVKMSAFLALWSFTCRGS